MTDAFIGLGANIDNPAAQLVNAVQHLTQLRNCELVGCSRVYESPPLGPQDQPNFLNACVHLRTSLTPQTLLEALQTIEQRMGREKRRHWGERCIDLDLLLFGHITLTTTKLTLPHPGIYEREFVLRPLADLVDQGFQMPNGVELGKLLARCPKGGLITQNLSLQPAEPPGEPR